MLDTKQLSLDTGQQSDMGQMVDTGQLLNTVQLLDPDKLFNPDQLSLNAGKLSVNPGQLSSISLDGSVFGCHCENSFPDSHNNIRCYRNRIKLSKMNFCRIFSVKFTTFLLKIKDIYLFV